MTWLHVLATFVLALAAGDFETDETETLLSELGAPSVEALIDSFPLDPDDATDRALKHLADLLMSSGDIPGAEALQRERLRGRVERFGEDDSRIETVLSDLGWLALRAGRFEQAVSDFEALLERARANHGENSLQVAVTRINLASAHQGVGEYGEVERDYLAAIEVVRELEGSDGPTLRVVLHNLAVFLMEQGELGAAGRHAEEAHRIQIARSGPDSTQVQESLQLLGMVHTAQGRIELAELELRQALALARELFDEDDARLGDTSRYLGDVLRKRGDLEGAADAWALALAIYTESYGERHFNTVRALHATGLLAQGRGDLDRALQLIERSVALSDESFDSRHPAHVQRLLNLASLLVERGELERAEALCRAVLEPTPDTEPLGPLRQADARAHLGEVLLADGRAAEAAEVLAAALELRTGALGPGHRDLLDVQVLLADALERSGDLPAAEKVVAAGIEIAERHRSSALGDEIERARTARTLFHRRLTDQGVRLALARGAVDEALESAEQGRGRLLLDLLQRNERELLRGDGERRADLERAIAAEDRARFRLREAEARNAAEDEFETGLLDRVRAELSEASATVFTVLRGAWPETVPLDAGELLEGLEPGELLLSYTFTGTSVVLIAAVPPASPGKEGELRAWNLAKGAEASRWLGERAAALSSVLARSPDVRGGFAEDEARTLAAALLPDEAVELVLESERLIAVLDGPMRALPLELLLLEAAKGAPLPELVQAPSATVFLQQRARSRRQPPASPRLVALAAPEFANTGHGLDDESGAEDSERAATLFGRDLAPLPATRSEVLRVAELCASRGFDRTLLLGEEATREALEAAAGGASLLHLATHGIHGSDERPFDAALALTPEEDAGSAFLTLDRLVRRWSLRLEGCELVVLSACDTHREVRAGTGTLSLAWGFFHAGAPAVLATRWRIDDRAATVFVSRFYENLLGTRDGSDPLNPAAALREAQTWLREATRAELRAVWRSLGTVDSGSMRSADSATDLGTRTEELRPYADPFFWAAFVLLGSPD